ncbi:MAG: hypothetical protein ACRD17_03535 [Terriglobales bacterium]
MPRRVAGIVLRPAAAPAGPPRLHLWRPTLIASGDFIAGADVFYRGAGASLGLGLPLAPRFSLEPAVSLNWRGVNQCEQLVPGCNFFPKPQPPETTITVALLYHPFPAATLRPFVEAGGGAEDTPDYSGGWRRVLFFGGGASLPLGVWGLRFRPEVRIFAEHPLTGTPFQLMVGLSRTF